MEEKNSRDKKKLIAKIKLSCTTVQNDVSKMVEETVK